MSEAFFEFGFCPSVRKQLIYNLKVKHQTVKALQERVVQVARDAFPFQKALAEPRLQLSCY